VVRPEGSRRGVHQTAAEAGPGHATHSRVHLGATWRAEPLRPARNHRAIGARRARLQSVARLTDDRPPGICGARTRETLVHARAVPAGDVVVGHGTIVVRCVDAGVARIGDLRAAHTYRDLAPARRLPRRARGAGTVDGGAARRRKKTESDQCVPDACHVEQYSNNQAKTPIGENTRFGGAPRAPCSIASLHSYDHVAQLGTTRELRSAGSPPHFGLVKNRLSHFVLCGLLEKGVSPTVRTSLLNCYTYDARQTNV
jgi:hypothetical protein